MGRTTTTDPAALPRPPGPRGWPLLGSASLLAPETCLANLRRLRAEYGDVFRVELPGRTMVVVGHPDHIEHVLVKHRSAYIKGANYDVVRDLMGDSLVTLEDREHKVRRRIAQPAFHKRSLAGLAEIMVEATTRWFDELRARMPDGGRVDVHREMTHITLEIVVECLFGRGFFQKTNVSYETLTGALETMSRDINGVPVPRWVPTPGNLRFRRVLKALDQDVHALIAAAREAMANGSEDGTLLQMLLNARDAETGESLDDTALRDEVVTLFIAGHETTALTMTWLIDLVSEEPEVLARLRAEVETLPPRPTFADLVRLEYVRRVTDEVLRLRPAAPWVARAATKPDAIGGFRIEPGDMVTPSFWLVHHHAEHWPDPERFDPDRFLPDAVKARSRYAHVPFSTGTRICIGNQFSYVETAAIVAELVRRCTWTRVGTTRPEPQAIATVRPSEPIHIDLRWRA